jgi:hypothetical protein
MFKPFFLGVNDATMGDWLFLLGIVIVLIVIAGIVVYYTGSYITIRRPRKDELSK